MNLALTGYKQLKDCKGGELIRFADGTFAMMSIYDSSDTNIKASYLWGSGDAMGSGQDPNEWVAVIDLSTVDKLFEHSKYPVSASHPTHNEKS